MWVDWWNSESVETCNSTARTGNGTFRTRYNSPLDTGYDGTGYVGTGYHGTGYDGTGYHGTAYYRTAYNGAGYYGTADNGSPLRWRRFLMTYVLVGALGHAHARVVGDGLLGRRLRAASRSE